MRLYILRTLLAAAGIGIVAYPSHVYSQSKAPLEFEVATVKPSAPGENASMQIQPGGGIRMKNVTLKALIAFAYQLRDFQISGGPGWINADRFDIEAKSEAADVPLEFNSMTDEQLQEMDRQFKERMKSLLADRFQLLVRQESKEMPIYVLVQAKGGSKLQPAKDQAAHNQRMTVRRGVLTCVSSPVASLANSLSNQMERPVVDKTGLAGKFDFKLEWTLEQPQSKPGSMREKEASNPPDLTGPSLFTALQEQLGLKLESQKGPAAVLIVERAERPSAN